MTQPPDTAEPPCHATRADLRERAAGLAQNLAAVLKTQEPELPAALAKVIRFDVTGIGASEGPARLLASVLVENGIFARFLPMAAFVREQQGEQAALIVFSQGLSPNARLALRQASRYESALLFTSTRSDEGNGKGAVLQAFRKMGGVICEHPPERESGSLVRLVGPACAHLAALRFSGTLLGEREQAVPTWVTELSLVPGAVEAASQKPKRPLGSDPAALIGPASTALLLPSLAWKWQEALYAPLPHVFDLLTFMHGPLQSLHARPSTLLFCASAETHDREHTEIEEELCSRFRRVLTSEPHTLVELRSQLSGPLAWFEFDALLTQLVLAELDVREIDPGCWPAQGHDAPLYQVGE